jgi:hypothetical protein
MATMLLVQGDTRTQIKTTITRAYDGSAVDLNTTSSVVLRFRKTYTTTVLFTLSAVEASAGDYALGNATFSFAADNLDIDAGDYEGEVEVVYSSDGTKETVFEVISFIVRQEFA